MPIYSVLDEEYASYLVLVVPNYMFFKFFSFLFLQVNSW